MPECFDLMQYIAIDSAEKSEISKLTVAKLLKDGTNMDANKSASAEPVALSKKQRDAQKKLDAIIRRNRN